LQVSSKILVLELLIKAESLVSKAYWDKIPNYSRCFLLFA